MKKNILLVLVLILSLSFFACFSINNSDPIQTKTITVGEVFEINTEDAKSYKSSSEEIATVTTDGIVQGVGVGTCTISISTSTKEYSIKVVVKENASNVRIEYNSKQTIKVGEEINLNAKVTNSTDSYVFQYSSNDETIATVSSSGVVKGINEGICQITIKVTGTVVLSRDILIYVSKEASSSSQTNTINVTTTEIDNQVDLSSISNQVVSVVNENKNSVIGVSNYQYVSSYIGGRQLVEASVGTGFIFKKAKSGSTYTYYAITNHHVIKDNYRLRVFFGYEDEYVDCELVGSNENLDLAVVKFDYKKELKVLELSSEVIRQGDFAIAIGSSNGYEYFGTVTFGIISYVNRTLTGEDAVFLQHDVAINPGNSGGPLFSLDGKVIGVNTLKIVDESVENMGFSISIDTVKKYLQTLDLL